MQRNLSFEGRVLKTMAPRRQRFLYVQTLLFGPKEKTILLDSPAGMEGGRPPLPFEQAPLPSGLLETYRRESTESGVFFPLHSA